MTTVTRWHVYRNGELAGVYADRTLAEQDVAGWSPHDQVVVVRAVETRDVETVYGLVDGPPWPAPPAQPIPVVRTVRSAPEVRGAGSR